MARKVGFLVAATTGEWDQYIGWFKEKLAKLRSDADVTLWPQGGADGDDKRINDAASYLAQQHFEVIVTSGTQAAVALQKATKTTPFVFASVGEPAISGLSPTPGGNFTGCSNQQVSLVQTRVDQMLADARFQGPFAVVGNDSIPLIKSVMKSVVTELQKRGMQAQPAPIAPTQNIDTFISGLKNIKSLYVCSDMFITKYSTDLNHAARKANMKTMFEFAAHVTQHGGHLSYGINFQCLFEKAAEYVDSILSGTTKAAGDLPIWEPPESCRELKKKS